MESPGCGSLFKKNVVQIKEVLANPVQRALFERFCAKTYCLENLHFVQRVMKLKQHAEEDPANLLRIQQDAEKVYSEFIDENAPREINIDHATRADLKQKRQNLKTLPIAELVTMYDETARSVLDTLHQDTYLKFVESSLFKEIPRMKLRARTDYEPPSSDGLSLKQGDELYFIHAAKSDTNPTKSTDMSLWIQAANTTGQIGWIPRHVIDDSSVSSFVSEKLSKALRSSEIYTPLDHDRKRDHCAFEVPAVPPGSPAERGQLHVTAKFIASPRAAAQPDGEALIDNTLGTLHVLVIEARHLRSRGSKAARGPFVVVRYGLQKRKVKMAKETAQPIFDAKLEYVVSRNDNVEELTFEVWDHHHLRANRLIGGARMPLRAILPAAAYSTNCMRRAEDRPGVSAEEDTWLSINKWSADDLRLLKGRKKGLKAEAKRKERDRTLPRRSRDIAASATAIGSSDSDDKMRPRAYTISEGVVAKNDSGKTERPSLFSVFGIDPAGPMSVDSVSAISHELAIDIVRATRRAASYDTSSNHSLTATMAGDSTKQTGSEEVSGVTEALKPEISLGAAEKTTVETATDGDVSAIALTSESAQENASTDEVQHPTPTDNDNGISIMDNVEDRPATPTEPIKPSDSVVVSTDSPKVLSAGEPEDSGGTVSPRSTSSVVPQRARAYHVSIRGPTALSIGVHKHVSPVKGRSETHTKAVSGRPFPEEALYAILFVLLLMMLHTAIDAMGW